MRAIAEVARRIGEEVADVAGYSKLASWFRDSGDEESGKAIHEIARQEMEHADRLHAIAVRLVERASKEEPQSAGMMAVWEFEHDRMMEELAHARTMLSQY